MNPEEVKVGIAGLGFYYPETQVDTKTIADELNMTEKAYNHIGIKHIYIPTEKEQSTFMAYEAAKNAIEDAGISGDEIDMIIVSAFKTDYLHWPLSSYLKEKLGAKHALTVDIKGACAAYFEAIQTGVDQIRAMTGVNTVLVVSGERLYGYGWPSFLSAGGQAVVLKRDCDQFNYMKFSINNYIKYHDMASVKYGGTAFPFTPEMEWNGDTFVGNVVVDEAMYYEHIKPYVFPKFVEVVNDVLDKSNYTLDDVDYMITLVQQESFDRKILEAIGRPDIPTAQEFKSELGHFSGGDIYVLLDKARKNNRIKKGDLILIVGIGGVAWFSSLMRY